MDLSMLDAAMYLRKSRAEEGQSVEAVLQRHRETLTAYAAAHGIHIMETYSEVASGESLYARPQMLRLLEDVEAGRYDCVLCMDLDRLSRGRMRDQGIVLDAFKDSGTLIVTPERVYDLSSETDEQFAEIKTFLSRQEYRMISKRLQDGRMHSIQNGCYISNAPYGYRNATHGKSPTLEIYEPEAEFVRLIFQTALKGIGGTIIARTINEMGARTRTGNEFDRLAINRILHNPVYIGKVRWNRQIGVKTRDGIHHHKQPIEKWLVTDGIHQPIIDAATFDAVQEILEQRHTGPHFDGTNIENPLAGIVRCKNCGGRMQRCISRGHMIYLFCPKKGCCAMSPLTMVEDRIIDHLSQCLAEIEISPLTSGITEQAHLAALETIKERISTAKAVKSRLYELVETGAYTITEFQERMNATKEKISRLREEEKAVSDALEQTRKSNPEKQAAKIRNVLDLYQAQDGAGRNTLLKSVIDMIYYTKEKGAAATDFILEIDLKGS